MVLPFDTITATTLQLIRRRLADNIFKASNFAAWMLARGRVQMVSGGKFLQEPLMYATNGTVKAYAGYERLNVAPTDELTAAQYSYRQAAVRRGHRDHISLLQTHGQGGFRMNLQPAIPDQVGDRIGNLLKPWIIGAAAVKKRSGGVDQ